MDATGPLAWRLRRNDVFFVLVEWVKFKEKHGKDMVLVVLQDV